MERICRNCGLWDAKNGVCKVTIINEGEYYEISTQPNDPCVWDALGVEIQQMRVWSDGTNGYIETSN